MATHEVTNQVPALTAYDLFGRDAVRVEAMDRWGDPGDLGGLHDLGEQAGSAQAVEWGD